MGGVAHVMPCGRVRRSMTGLGTLGGVHVHPESLDLEVRLTVETAIEIANVHLDGDVAGEELHERLREILVDHDFLRARGATADEMAEFADRAVGIARLVGGLPDSELSDVVEQVNHHLQSSAIAPALSAHDGLALHIHWTGPTTPFAHQVSVDLLMALAQTLCDHGLDRFGRCGAESCDHVFFDTTKNRSRRFCSDPRCASRTHTAAHRARQTSDT
jgi:hypothetical protein